MADIVIQSTKEYHLGEWRLWGGRADNGTGMKTRSRTFPNTPAGFLRRVYLLLGAGLAVALFLIPPPVYGWEGTYFDLFEISNSPRTAAMGGLHCALADDGSTLFSNPAGLRSLDRDLKVSEMTLNMYESAVEIASETFSGLPGSSSDRRATFSLWGPLAFSYTGKGRGFGIFNNSNVYLHAWGQSPSANVVMEDNLVLIGARAFRLPLPERSRSTLDVGISLVTFATLRGIYDFDIRQLFQASANMQDMLASSGLFQRGVGAGLELGVLYSFSNLFSIGLAGRNLAITQTRDFATILDFFSGGTSTSWYVALPLDVSVGILFRPPLGKLERIFSDLVITADYHNIFDFLIYADGATDPLLHIGAGLELKLLDIVSLRAGYYQCLPSFGVGLDLTLFKLNFAYFGRELSAEPGQHAVGCYTVGVEFSYEAAARRATRRN
jgi:hypothetical protein